MNLRTTKTISSSTHDKTQQQKVVRWHTWPGTLRVQSSQLFLEKNDSPEGEYQVSN